MKSSDLIYTAALRDDDGTRPLPHGVLTRDADGRLLCHVCGRSYVQLGTHVWHTHEMCAETYRETFGLRAQERLASEDYRRTLRRVNGEQFAALSPITSPAGIAAANEALRDPACRMRTGARMSAARRGRRHSAERRANIAATTTRGGKLNPDAVREIRRLRAQGATGKEVAARFGVTPAMISGIVRGRAWPELAAHKSDPRPAL